MRTETLRQKNRAMSENIANAVFTVNRYRQVRLTGLKSYRFIPHLAAATAVLVRYGV
jgi:hypothetical protein